MLYVTMKELATAAEDTIMITSQIMRDTTVQSEVVYRPNAVRALIRIIDASTAPQIERLIKTAIVDKQPSCSSAALVSSYHLLPVARDIVRRWGNEVQSAIEGGKSSGGFMGFGAAAQLPTQNSYHGQYHAIGL